MVGGYKIISFKGNNFTSGATVSIPGISEEIERAINKVLMVRDFSVNGVEQEPFFSTAYVSSGNYYLFRTMTTSQVHRFEIQSDNVTYKVASISSAGGSSTPAEDGPSASM